MSRNTMWQVSGDGPPSVSQILESPHAGLHCEVLMRGEEEMLQVGIPLNLATAYRG